MSKITLAERLKLPVARVLGILEHGSYESLSLQKACLPNSFITKRTLEYTIPCLKMTAAKHQLASLSTKQVELNSSIVVVHKNLIENKWNEYEASPDAYTAYINPKVSVKRNSKPIEEAWESCASLPNIEALCKRHKEIRLIFQNSQGDYEEIELNGFEARVLQHEADHLHGQLMIHPKISEGRLKSDNEAVKKVIQMIESEIFKRKDKFQYLENKSQLLKDRIQHAEKPTEEVCHDMIFTKEFHMKIFSDIGQALYGQKIDQEEFKDIDWMDFVSTLEDDIMRRSTAKTFKKPK